MGIDFLVLMKQEWMVIVILFILLFIKVSGDGWQNRKYFENGEHPAIYKSHSRIYRLPGGHSVQ